MITIGFSSHHVETLPYVREQMEKHEVIVLEEPPSSQFPAMLGGTIPISDYIMELDSGFPEFEHRMCMLLRGLYKQGGRIIQVEPYLEKLIQIHELFASGATVDKVMRVDSLKDVYLAERRATEALISYYAISINGPFQTVVEAVKRFARADALRLTLRERLRARAIASVYDPAETMYVEAGYIHYPLYRHLRYELSSQDKIHVVFPLAPVVKKLQGKRRNMGPGDILTLHYAFHNGLRKEMADMLAARSLIYIKLIRKEELTPATSETPHAEDELKVNRLVDRLTFAQCRQLYEQIRLAKQARAVEIAEEFVKKN